LNDRNKEENWKEVLYINWKYIYWTKKFIKIDGEKKEKKMIIQNFENRYDLIRWDFIIRKDYISLEEIYKVYNER